MALDERRVKEAFGKVKRERDKILFDINAILKRLEGQEKALDLHSDVKKQIDVLNRVNLEKFVAKLDKEIDTINAFIADMNKRTDYVNDAMKKFSHNMEVQQVQYDDLKSKLHDVQKQAQNNKLDMKVISDHGDEMQELVDEKIAMENGALRLEMQTGFAEQSVEMNKLSDKVDGLLKLSDENDEALPEIFEEFALAVDKRVEDEMKVLRRDLNSKLEDIQKTLKVAVKDRVSLDATSSSTITTKRPSAPKKTRSKTTTSTSKKETVKVQVVEEKKETPKKKEVKTTTSTPKRVPQEEKKEGVFKKTVKWLFVDEDEDETLKSVKKETTK